MGRKRKIYYTEEIIARKKQFYLHLPEKARRHYLGQEYLNLGKGSQRYLAETFGCSRDTIRKAVKELNTIDFIPDYSWQRAEGGGRKKKSRNIKA